MRRYLFIAAAFVLAGCEVSQPTGIYHRTGSSFAERSRAYDLCSFDAIKAVPRAMATTVSGGYYNPGTTYCTGMGNTATCNQVGAVNIPPASTTYDANQELRLRYMDRCMEGKGYALLMRPICQSEADRAKATAQRSQPQLPADQISCILSKR